MTDLRKAAEMALEALNQATGMCAERTSTRKDIDEAITALRQALEQPDPFSRLVRIMGTFDLSTGHADNWNDLLDSLESELRDVLGYYREAFKAEQECSTHPDAPHGFNRDASHGLGRYVCDCEGWEPPDDDAAWATHLKEPVSEKRVHKSDTIVPSDYSGKAGDYTEQEPVAWMYEDELPESYPYDLMYPYSKVDGVRLFPVYIAPPKQPWIGLTDEERNNLWREVVGWGDPSHDDEDLMKAIEAKLKEKNT